MLDIFNPSLDLLASGKVDQEYGEEPEFETPDGRRILRRQRTVACDRFEQVNQFELIYYDFPLRYLFKFEAAHLLARSGFEVEHVYAGYDKSPG